MYFYNSTQSTFLQYYRRNHQYTNPRHCFSRTLIPGHSNQNSERDSWRNNSSSVDNGLGFAWYESIGVFNFYDAIAIWSRQKISQMSTIPSANIVENVRKCHLSIWKSGERNAIGEKDTYDYINAATDLTRILNEKYSGVCILSQPIWINKKI